MRITKPHWAPCSYQTPSWYDWKTVESGVKPEYTHFSEAFPSNSNDLECIKMETTKPRCIKFRTSLRCIDVLVILLLKQIPLSNGYKYPMLWGYRMRCSWIKRNIWAPNKNLTSEKAKIDKQFKKITYPSGWMAPRMIAKCKKGSPSARHILNSEWFLYSVC